MRKIKFRGQTVDTKELIYGDLIQTEKDFKKVVEILDWSKVGCKPEKSLVVIPETVGQFTGLTDKNGVKIFEGDILSVEIFTKPYVVSFGKSEKWGACFCVQSFNSITFLTKNWSDSSEVIGNIHDNPELV